MGFSGTNKSEFANRLSLFQESLQKLELDGAILMQRVDLVYYTGSVYQGALLVPASGESRLYTWRGQGRITDICPVEPVAIKGIGKLQQTLACSEYSKWRKIGYEADVLPVNMFERFIKNVWIDKDFTDISMQIRRQRSVKTEYEQQLLRESGKILADGFKAVPGIIKPGMPEFEVQLLMELEMAKAGDQGIVRSRAFNTEADGVVAYGHSAATDSAFDGPLSQPGRSPIVPVKAGKELIGREYPTIVDVTAGVDGYMTDMTRVFAYKGIDNRFIEAHDLCVEIQEETISKMVPGAIPEDIYNAAVEKANKAGFGDVFMNSGDNRVRFIGHGVGLELDEIPIIANRFKEPLVENMVVAIEPKVIFDDGAVGVEDTLIVKEGGAEVLTKHPLGIVFLD